MDAFREFRTALTFQVDLLQEQLFSYCEDAEAMRAGKKTFRDSQNVAPTTSPPKMLFESLENGESGSLRQIASQEGVPTVGLAIQIPGAPTEEPSSPRPLGPEPTMISEAPAENLIRRWEILTEGIWTIPTGTLRIDRGQVQLRSMWKLSQDSDYLACGNRDQHSRSQILTEFTNNQLDNITGSSTHIGEAIRTDSCIQPFVCHPDSRLSLLHALICSLLIMYDVISFPLIAFDLEGSPFLTWMTWMTTIFWTLDIPMSFLQGYHSQGIVEMRPVMVARHYMRTWLIPDAIIVGIDWALVISQADGGNILRAGKATRSPRFLRAARVLRLIRTLEAAAAVVDAVANETMIVAARVLALLLFILAINHYVACGWYALAEYNRSGQMTWLTVAQQTNEGDSDFAKYMMSLSWSLTQFTPATNDITPANVRERVFATITVLFAFVLFSFLVSSLTNAMMEIKNLNIHKHNEERLIRDFLGNKKVSLEVGNRIWHYYRKHYKMAKRAARESDINFFKEIPSSLRTALHTQIFMPVLLVHPVFEQLCKFDLNSMRQVCNVLEENCFVPGFELFSTGDLGSRMYFVTSGSLRYDCALYVAPVRSAAPLWVSEAALWAKWTHCGNLLVQSSAEILLLDSHRFEKVMLQYTHEAGLMRCLRKYATLFVHHASNHTVGEDAVTDIHNGDGSANDTLKMLSHRAFASSSLSKRSWQSIFLPDAMQDLLTNGAGDAKTVEKAAIHPKNGFYGVE